VAFFRRAKKFLSSPRISTTIFHSLKEVKI